MKNTLKIEKGITLITLIITVLILVIITSAMAVNSHNSNELSKITKLQNDINALESRVASYFVEFDELPIYGNSYTKNEILNIC